MSERNLTDEDVKAIVRALEGSNSHNNVCRFRDVEPLLLKEVVDFYKNFNNGVKDSQTLVRRGITIMALVFVLGAMWNGLTAGLSEKLQSILGIFK